MDITDRYVPLWWGPAEVAIEFRVDQRDQILQRLSLTAGHGIEDLALSLLALRKTGVTPEDLVRFQRLTGGWSEFPNISEPSAFHTALALLALRPYHRLLSRTVIDRAFQWLSALRGRESHWIWQWKFRLFDRQVRFDPAKSGWPWVAGTVSWVAPTALSILAYRTWHRESPRIASANEMLLDRACPRGGWNSGNSIVFGVELEPHPDFTAMALLALKDSIHDRERIVNSSLDYLSKRLLASCSLYSLAWAVMALTAYNHGGAEPLRKRLNECVALGLTRRPNRIIALTALALEEPGYAFREAVP